MKDSFDPNKKFYNAESEKAQNVVGSKLAQMRQYNHLSLQQTVERLQNYGIHIAAPTVYKWEKGITTPSPYHLIALSNLYGIRNIEVFFNSSYIPDLNEAGERKVAEYRADLVASGNYKPIQHAEILYIKMPVSLLSASAGTGAFLDEGNFEEVMFPADSVPPKADFALKVSGDSMEPVFNDGQYVWVQKCSELHLGEVGIFSLDGQGYIKVYSEQTPEDCDAYTDSNNVVHAQPVLISYNKKYSPIVVTQDQAFQICGRVLK